jgi:hypothetical protein
MRQIILQHARLLKISTREGSTTVGMPMKVNCRAFFSPSFSVGLRFVFSCFGHVVNIANVAVMSCVTQIAAIENATAIWEYDPSLPGNRILGGSLDVIAAIRTIAVKVSVFLRRFHFLHRS